MDIFAKTNNNCTMPYSSKIRRWFLLSALLALNIFTSVAQNATKTLSGRVVDESGAPLPGVGVLQKGTLNGAVSDQDGLFRINVEPDAVLSFSMIGYEDIEVPAATYAGEDILMKESSTFLEETVVVGYAVQKKVNLTGAVSSVNMDEVLNGRPVTDISSGLAGLTAGLYVNQNTGRPNADGATVLVRGRGTLNNSSPLVIIDGIESDIGSVTPQDVESISILKDASSSAIYGSRAANGVILITTKKGSEGKFSLSYDGYVSVARPSHLVETVSNYADYMSYYNEALKNTDPSAKPTYSQEMIDLWENNTGDPERYPNTDWTKTLFRTGIAHNHNVSFRAGAKRISVYGSLGYLNNEGIMENSAYERYSARLNASADVTSWLKVGINFNGRISKADAGSNSVKAVLQGVGAPGITYQSSDGRYGGIENPEENAQLQSPLYTLNSTKGDIRGRYVAGRFFAAFQPVAGLSIEGSLNYINSATLDESYPDFRDCWSFRNNTIVKAADGKTYVTNGSAENARFTADVVARYSTDFAKKLHMDVLIGASEETFRSHSFSTTKYDLIDPRLTVLNATIGDATSKGGTAEWAMISAFGRLNLSWDEKYFLEANFRADGSSRFKAGKNRWGFFPSFSLGWRLDRENFLKSATAVDLLKIRASYGSLGNNAVGNYEYQSVYKAENYVLGNSVAMGLAQFAIANSDITWETTYVANVGIDFGFWKSKLTGSVDFYDKDTRNILIDLPAPLLVGTATTPTQNAARVNNKGVDLQLLYRNRAGEFNYRIGANLSYNRNRVTKYKGDEATISGSNMIKEGYPINVQYVLAVDRILQTNDDMLLVKEMQKNAPVDPSTGKRKNPFAAYGTPQLGDLLYKDMNGDGIIDENDRYAVGNGNTPTFIYGMTLGFDWKGLDFSAVIQGNAGYKVLWMDDFQMGYFNYGGVMNKAITDGAWRAGRTDATYPRLLTRTNPINNQLSDFWVEDKSYVRLKNVQLGYSLPQKWVSAIKMTRLRVYFSAENLLTFTKYRGLDPEVSGTNYPTLKQYIFGLNVSF